MIDIASYPVSQDRRNVIRRRHHFQDRRVRDYAFMCLFRRLMWNAGWMLHVSGNFNRKRSCRPVGGLGKVPRREVAGFSATWASGWCTQRYLTARTELSVRCSAIVVPRLYLLRILQVSPSCRGSLSSITWGQQIAHRSRGHVTTWLRSVGAPRRRLSGVGRECCQRNSHTRCRCTPSILVARVFGVNTLILYCKLIMIYF